MGIEGLGAAFEEAEVLAPEPEAVEPVVETPEEPEIIEPPVEEAPKTVPLPTFLDQRDELKEAKRRLAELESAKEAPNANVPDPYDNPEGYHAYTESVVQQKLTNQRFEMSHELAVKEFGKETVDTATAWAQEKAATDPTFYNNYMSKTFPIEWIVQQHTQDALVREASDDPVAFARKIAEREGWLTAPAAVIPAVVESTPAPATPRRSMAAEPSKHGAVKDVPIGPMQALGAVFPS